MTAEEHAAEAEALGRRYPGWTFWFGRATRTWWALPPARSRARDLIEAGTPQALIARIEVVRQVPDRRSAPIGAAPTDGPRPSPQPRQDARRPSNLLRLEGVTPPPFRRVPVIAWPGSTAR
ncbi:hypothetical protein [Spirillospora albida]|uniref:hypothetical protein n=1 Tax=Spirillospora albida TaxID=58123 RepID=UPI0004C00E55|nr:hypothetical protein [Spirillospora albida]